MYSLHFTGSLWFLLLIPPGLWILWRQYQGGMAGGAAVPSPRRILFALQALAMLILAVSLTAPELRRHRVKFHNPAILVLRDQSSSFQGGAYLGLGGAYRDFEMRIAEAYGKGNYDIRVADFSEWARPVSGFPRTGRPEGRAASTEGGSLTSLVAAADFIDSAAVPNLQAVFLFSDGRANLDSAKASRTWRVPLFPVVFPPDSLSEIQPERAKLWTDGESPELELTWRKVGKGTEGPNLVVLQGGKTVLTRKLPASGMREGGEGRFRIPWTPEKSAPEGGRPLRAALMPSDPARNMDPFNDTLDVESVRGRAERVIHVLRPIRSLDEKGMLGILQAWEGTRVDFFGAEDIGRLSPGAGDQIWVEAGALASAGLVAWLLKTPAQAVVYARPAPGRNLNVTGGERSPWRAYSPAAEIKAGRMAAEAFPVEAVRLKSLADASLDLPDAGAGVFSEQPDAGGGVRVEVREGGRRGILMGRIPLGESRQAFFFCLPAIWGPLFDPQGDFATRENIAAYVKAAYGLASEESGAVRVSRPARAYHEVPFDVDVRMPSARASGSAGAVKGAKPVAAELAVSGPGFERSWPLPESQGREAVESRIKGISLPRGGYRMELRAGAQSLWRDSLTVAPRAALELARIGFDRPSLDDAASRSGGRVLEPAASGSSGAGVAFKLPELPGAQIRMEKTSSIRLYNTLAQCLLVLLLLSSSWYLRKKWDFD
jgi:hypothetical protein